MHNCRVSDERQMEAFWFLLTISSHLNLSFLWPEGSFWNTDWSYQPQSDIFVCLLIPVQRKPNTLLFWGWICGHANGWFLVPPARLYMLTLFLFLLHVFALATPSYWKTLLSFLCPANVFLVLPCSAQVSRPSCVPSMVSQNQPPRKASLPASLLSLCWSISLVNSASLRAKTRGLCTLPLPHTMPGAL